MYCKCNQYLLLSALINGTYVGHTIAQYIVRYNDVDQTDEQVLAIL